MPQPDLYIAAMNPAHERATHARLERGRRNLEWLAEHWADLLPQARGRFVAVAGQEGHVADSATDAWVWAKANHPEDDGAVVQHVRNERGPRR